MEHPIYTEADIAFTRDLVLEAGDLAKDILRDGYITEWKSDNTPVTSIDRRINDLIIERIRHTYTNDRVYGEEKSIDGTSGYTWVADPWDGTQSLGLFPTGTICLARVSPGGLPQFSFVYNPVTDELFGATDVGQVTLNEQTIQVSKKDKLKGSYVFLGSKIHSTTIASNGTIYDRLESEGVKVMNVRSLAFSCCMVAAGKAEGALIGVRTPFEAASVQLLVEGAGGIVTDLEGNPSSSFRYDGEINGLVVSNGKLHKEMLGSLALVA